MTHPHPAHRPLRRGAAALGASVLALSLGACGLSKDASSAGSDLGSDCGGLKATDKITTKIDGTPVTVGSKDFDEQLVLGALTTQYLCLAGADATADLNTQGSTQARDKVIRGDNDVMWEYTGTGWINYLGHDTPIFDPQEQYDKVKAEDAKKNGVYWGPLAPFNNTYAFAVPEAFGQKNHLTTDSDMAAYLKQHPDATVCVESEFASRPDGYPGFKKAYGISSGDVKSLGTGVIYTQTGKGTCDFGEIFTTDGRIKANHLSVLEDDKQFFPLYNGVPITRVDFNDKHPEVMKALQPLADALTTEVMQKLNTEKSAQGISESQVAHDYLVEAGFATEA
ncbi:glycine betaine ABC transporter substrate-binding protein [Nocardioides panaciterrulae]|uniref:Osmoprotectant transport system substrate-binding protein n=1 Tax=Nocardioides panaciterrulae TaxID=661492 RepID=A0A7Y9E812_9ACTN|nr:glycine betaine ABC transporter substrate-binding protein [Nocardioides panaciterrulae]NYD42928.1 osmoprotectant transport system substrate-binding protein [Nocardioides panaciterrulae]